jgi:hypothetical protein
MPAYLLALILLWITEIKKYLIKKNQVLGIPRK